MKIWVVLVIPFDFVESLRVFSTKEAAVEFANSPEYTERIEEEYGFGVDVYETEVDGPEASFRQKIEETGRTRDTC